MWSSIQDASARMCRSDSSLAAGLHGTPNGAEPPVKCSGGACRPSFRGPGRPWALRMQIGVVGRRQASVCGTSDPEFRENTPSNSSSIAYFPSRKGTRSHSEKRSMISASTRIPEVKRGGGARLVPFPERSVSRPGLQKRPVPPDPALTHHPVNPGSADRFLSARP